MKLEVQQVTLKKADQCKNNCICQTEGGKPHCRISETVNGTVFFTPSRNPMDCPYQCSFGSTFMCTCPVRQEIFRKHGV